MPIIQPYHINTGAAYEGMVYGLRTAMVIRTVEDADVAGHMEAGFAVKAKAATVRGVQVAATTAANENCYGIIVRQVNHEAAARPSLDGQMQINEGDLLGMLVEGEIMVRIKGAVARDANLGWNSTSKSFSSAGSTFKNVVALQPGSDGDIIPVRIFSVAQTPA